MSVADRRTEESLGAIKTSFRGTIQRVVNGDNPRTFEIYGLISALTDGEHVHYVSSIGRGISDRSDELCE
jgi:hypothetical protein